MVGSGNSLPTLLRRKLLMPQQSTARLISRYLPLLFWLGFMSFASSDEFSANNTSRIIGPLVMWLFPHTSPEGLATVHLIVRKAAHFTEYGILAFLAARAFRTSPGPFLSRHWFIAALLLIAIYALIDEYHQSFVPSRTASVYDSMIDVAGGLTILLFLSWRHRRRSF